MMELGRPLFHGRVGIIQRIVPVYRKPFFDALADRCQGGLQVFAGVPLRGEGIRTADHLRDAQLIQAKNIDLGDIERDIWYLCWQRGVKQWMQDWDPDVLIIQAFPRMLSNWVAIHYMNRRSRPVLGWGLGELPRPDGRLVTAVRRAFVRGMVQACDGIVSYSSKGVQDYIAYGAVPSRVFAAYNSVDNTIAHMMRKKIQSRPGMVERWKKEMLGYKQMPIILFVGRLLFQKRVDLLIHACAGLDIGFHLVIVGDGPERTNLEEMARSLLPNTMFLGFKEGEELGLIFIASDIFVLPGTGGLAIQEAMAYGKPVIVADGDGTERDLVRPGNGYLVEPGNVNVLRARLETLLNDAELRQEMGEESLRIAKHEINLETMTNSFVNAMTVVSRKK